MNKRSVDLVCSVALSLLVPLTAPNAIAAPPSPAIFLTNSISCRSESEPALRHMVDAANENQFAMRLKAAVYSGDCLVTQLPLMIGKTTLLRTNKGNPYVCFDNLDPDTAKVIGRECTLANATSTIAAEIQRRTGDYKLTISTASLSKAECLEGGIVMIATIGDHLERTSHIFPNGLDSHSRTVKGKISSLLREGCKGLDYQ